MAGKMEVVVTANIYRDVSLIAVVQFHLSERGKWGKVFADDKTKKVIEGRLKTWEGRLDNGQDLFDVLSDLDNSLGVEHRVVSLEVVE
jgi:hypothetical protein